MAFQPGSTTVSQNTQGDLNYEITHLSTICAQPCVFTGPDAEAGALTYAGVRVLLLRAIEQHDQMNRLFSMIQSLSQETRNSILSCENELGSLRTTVATLQQNVHEIYSTLQTHGHRLDQFDTLTQRIQNIDGVLASFEQHIQNNANAISQLDGQQREFSRQIQTLCPSETMERRVNELHEHLSQRLAMLDQSQQSLQAQNPHMNHISKTVSEQLHAHITPLDHDIHALYNLWDLNKAQVHNVVNGGTTQHRVQLLHATPPFVSIMEMMRTPPLPTVTVGPASMGGSSNISAVASSYGSNNVPPLSPRSTPSVGGSSNISAVTSYGSSNALIPLSPRSTATTKSEQASRLGIEVGPSSDNSGVVITRVFEGTPASRSGLRVGDNLVAMCDQTFSNVAELLSITKSTLASKPRGGANISLTRRAPNGYEKVNLYMP